MRRRSEWVYPRLLRRAWRARRKAMDTAVTAVVATAPCKGARQPSSAPARLRRVPIRPSRRVRLPPGGRLPGRRTSLDAAVGEGRGRCGSRCGPAARIAASRPPVGSAGSADRDASGVPSRLQLHPRRPARRPAPISATRPSTLHDGYAAGKYRLAARPLTTQTPLWALDRLGHRPSARTATRPRRFSNT